ncbi:MAG: serine hydrolase [Candidatus Nealsonbacteria bacterium]|nr:serine hydrolase [Candidatus Nealsonbacteria bacterium]
MSKNVIFIILFILSIGLNVILGFRLKEIKKPPSQPQSPEKSSFKLVNPISPIIDSNIQESSVILHYIDLKPKIEEEIQKFKAEKNAAFFLQDVQTGAWLGINEREGFMPASLLKVPIMMAFLKKVDREEVKLTDFVELTAEDLDKNAGKLYQKGVGTKMTIWDLIKEMILTSDNTAKNALKRQLTEAELNAVFAHVGIPNPYVLQNGQVVSPRGYTRILKSLYFATFLSPSLSEKALDIMTDTEMENLISAAIPSEVQVAHKFSERPDGLGDCGIVYQPKNPYFLCMMTKDMEIPKAKELITNLSKIVYLYVSKK